MEEWLRQGEAAFAKGRFAEAEKSFQMAAQCSPFHPGPHTRLGTAYWRQGKTEDALNSYTRALELDPEHRDAVMNCAEVLIAFDRREDARLVLDAYFAKHPDDEDAARRLKDLQVSDEPESLSHAAEFFNEQGEAQFMKGKTDHARACFEMALEHDPHHATALSNLATVICQQGDAEGALEILYRAFDASPDDPDILHNCYEVLKAVGEWETAASFLQVYLQRGYGHQEDWDRYDQLMRRLGTASWSPQGLSMEAAMIHSQMGKSLCLAGDMAGGREAFEKALMIAPGDPVIYRQVAETLANSGMVEEAVDICREGLDHDPMSAELSEMMSGLLKLAESGQNAKTECENRPSPAADGREPVRLQPPATNTTVALPV
jgi:Flp pilus assembly protein TadD